MRTLGLYYRMMRACEIIPSPQSSMKMKKNIRQAFELRRDIPPSLLQERFVRPLSKQNFALPFLW